MSEIVCQDAIEFMAQLPYNSIDGVVTSPPYNIGVRYNSYNDSRSDYIDWSLSWIQEAIRVSRRGVMLNIGSKASDRNQLHKLLGAIAKEFIIQNEIIWAKSVTVAGKTTGHFKPINSDRFTNNTHEYIFHIVRAPVKIDKVAVGVPYEDKSNIGRFASTTKDLRCRGSVWFLPYETRQTQLDHPATFPIELAKMMIKFLGASSVLDPFIGSGTTAVAAKLLGIEFLGCDSDKAYVERANKRLRHVCG